MTQITDYARFWEDLADYFRKEIAPLSEEERAPYVRGAQGLRKPMITGSAPTPALMQFWKETSGRYIMIGYVATELGEIALMSMPFDEYRRVSPLSMSKRG